MSRYLVGICVAMMGPFAIAQQSVVAGPVSGFFYDNGSRSIRPLAGILGAASIGPAVLSDVDSAFIAPDGNWALAVRPSGSSFVRKLSDGSPVEFAPDDLIGGIDRAEWSRNGSAVLLYSSSGNQLQAGHLSAGGVTLDPPIDVSPFGAAVTLAINASGKRAAMGVAGAGLYVFDLNQFPVLTYGMAQPAAAAFDNSGDVLFVVDAGEQRILRVDASGAVTEFAALASPDGPPIVPVGLGISADGRTLLLAERTTPSIRVYDMASQALAATIPLDFTPSRFQRLAAAAFLLNGDSSEPEWLRVLDNRQNPTVVFVPRGEDLQ